ncbi:MAG: PIG-L family deacetylase [Halioglobus sp.]|nr:PIG-L family deacetylase [Halioglobus sp.]
MPTDPSPPVMPVAVVLICHQDDECGTYLQILRHRQLGRRVVCACFTRGVMGERDETQRNAESIEVLRRLGVDAADIVFAGSLLGIDDQSLIDNLPQAAAWLRAWLVSLGPVEVIYTTAWEGGHPDHDALHVISAQVCHELGLLGKLRQYPLYNSYQRPWQFFRSLYPLPANGPVERIRVPWSLRVRFLSYSFMYPSQLKSWLGIFPFFVAHYIFKGTAQLQAVSLERIAERPHEGALYYEKRGFSTWKHMRARIDEWLGSVPTGAVRFSSSQSR